MSGKRVFVRPVSKEAKYKPAVRVEFGGKWQADYFSIRKIAEEDFDVKQATLCRLILADWAKMYRINKEAGNHKKNQQMVMILKQSRPSATKQTATAGKAE